MRLDFITPARTSTQGRRGQAGRWRLTRGCERGDSSEPIRESTASSTCLSEVFPSVNTYHFQKATDIATGYASLVEDLSFAHMTGMFGCGAEGNQHWGYRREGRVGWQGTGLGEGFGSGVSSCLCLCLVLCYLVLGKASGWYRGGIR